MAAWLAPPDPRKVPYTVCGDLPDPQIASVRQGIPAVMAQAGSGADRGSSRRRRPRSGRRETLVDVGCCRVPEGRLKVSPTCWSCQVRVHTFDQERSEEYSGSAGHPNSGGSSAECVRCSRVPVRALLPGCLTGGPAWLF